MEKNLEDVSSTIKEIEEARRKRPRKEIAFLVLKWTFFPVALIVMLLRYIFLRQKVRLTTKTTIIFTILYAVLISFYVAFILISFKNYFESEGLANDFLASMVVSSVVMVVLFIFIGAVAGAVISNTMLRPIRRIIQQINSIDGQNLSLRLDPVDSQDEITELVNQINLMLSSLEESFERQANFVADASHELKTPLSVLNGYGNLLNRWGKDDAAILEEGIGAIVRESAYMAKIVEQMLLLAKLGQFNMVKHKFDLVHAVCEIVESYKIIDQKCEIEFKHGSQMQIEADKALLTEAVRAIIDNAIKYTPKSGKVTVYAGEEEGNGVVSVKDNGIGISAEDLPHIFDRFYRCDKTRGREKGNAGLGLTICDNIIQMMGGIIEVTSDKGQGSEFKIVINQPSFKG